MKLITAQKEFDEYCLKLSQSDFITVDTEFLRESTFWPKLCLLQMANASDEVIIDPLVAKLDLSAFFDLMVNTNVVKVFHAARQDLEIIYNLGSVIPTPLFDTQVAAMVCGFGDSVSYLALVKKLVGRDLDKTSQFTDWSRRPLSKKQLSYALGDVTHLRDIYSVLKERLHSSQREPWLYEEMRLLTDEATYQMKPADAWKRLKLRVKTKEQLGVLMELAAWREQEAQNQNVPRSRILKDNVLYDIANHMPKTQSELSSLRAVHDGIAKSAKGQDILQAVATGLKRDKASLPNLKKPQPLPTEATAVVDLLRVLLKTVTARHDVATKLIASADDLEKIAVDDEAQVPALKGWRFDLFGRLALDVKHGKIALGIQNGEISFIDTLDGRTAHSGQSADQDGGQRTGDVMAKAL